MLKGPPSLYSLVRRRCSLVTHSRAEIEKTKRDRQKSANDDLQTTPLQTKSADSSRRATGSRYLPITKKATKFPSWLQILAGCLAPKKICNSVGFLFLASALYYVGDLKLLRIEREKTGILKDSVFRVRLCAYLRYSRLEMIRNKRSASGSLNDVRFSSTSSFKAETRNSRACISCVDRDTTGLFASAVASMSRIAA